MSRVLSSDLKSHIGNTVILRGWLNNTRSLGKVNFVILRDRGGLAQVIVESKEEFKKIFNVLVLYKPSLRKALASKIQSRYTPELVFKYDEQFEKQMRLESLFEKIKHEGES